MLGVSALTLPPALTFGSTAGLPAATFQYDNYIENLATQVQVSSVRSNAASTAGTYTASYAGMNATSVLVAGPDPSVSTNVNQAGGFSTEAVGLVGYYIEFTGPNATVPVQINATASTPAKAGLAQIGISQAGVGYVFNMYATTDSSGEGSTMDWTGTGCSDNACGPITESQGTPLSVTNNQIWIAGTNVPYFVELQASSAEFAGTSSIDPTFSIASSVADPQDYSIVLSDGIGNSAASTAAPEPASWLYGGIGGIFLVGVSLGRRRFQA